MYGSKLHFSFSDSVSILSLEISVYLSAIRFANVGLTGMDV